MEERGLVLSTGGSGRFSCSPPGSTSWSGCCLCPVCSAEGSGSGSPGCSAPPGPNLEKLNAKTHLSNAAKEYRLSPNVSFTWITWSGFCFYGCTTNCQRLVQSGSAFSLDKETRNDHLSAICLLYCHFSLANQRELRFNLVCLCFTDSKGERLPV